MFRKIIYTVSAIILISCNNQEQDRGKSGGNDTIKKNNITKNLDTIGRQSSQIPSEYKSLLPEGNEYATHYLFDMDKDTISELMLVSKSNKRSDCLSPIYDSVCFYLDLQLFRKNRNSWKPVSSYHLIDFKNTSVNVDSLSNVIVKTYYHHTGHSKGSKIETYALKNNLYKLEKLILEVNTKLYSGYGVSNNTWEYLVNLDNQKASLMWTKTRLIKDSLVFKDSTLTFKIAKHSIELGQDYSLDSIIGEKNIYYYY